MTEEEKERRMQLRHEARELLPKVEQWDYLRRKGMGRMLSGKPRAAHLNWVETAWRNVKAAVSPEVLSTALEDFVGRNVHEESQFDRAFERRNGNAPPRMPNRREWRHTKRRK